MTRKGWTGSLLPNGVVKGGGRESGGRETRPAETGPRGERQDRSAANPAVHWEIIGEGEKQIRIHNGPVCDRCYERVLALEAELAALEAENRRFREALEIIRLDLNEFDAMRTRVAGLEAELAALEKEAVEGSWRARAARAEKAEAELIKERNRSHWRPGPNHDCDVSGCSSIEHVRGEDSG